MGFCCLFLGAGFAMLINVGLMNESMPYQLQCSCCALLIIRYDAMKLGVGCKNLFGNGDECFLKLR